MNVIASPCNSTRSAKRLPRFARFPLAFALTVFLQSCGKEPVGPPTCDFTGILATATQQEKDYLCKNLSTLQNGVIDWPPKALGRTVDISLDVTGSVYQRRIIYQDRYMSLAEYYAFVIHDHLTNNNSLRPGDRILVRLYGAKPGGKNVLVDQFKELPFPPNQLEIGLTTYSRVNSVDIEGKKLIRTESSANTVNDQIRKWFLDHVTTTSKGAEQFMDSPLLNHVHSVLGESGAATSERIFIFATDGHFSLGSLYFEPKSLEQNPRITERIEQECTRLKLKPFTVSDAKTTVVILGLVSNGSADFRAAQESVLRWFFDPQPVVLIGKG